MSAKRTKSTGLSERVGVAEERIEGLITQMSELKPDVKAILKTLGEIQIHIAKLPTWEALEKKATSDSKEREDVEDRLTILEAARTSVKAGWAVACFIGGVTVVAVGWGLSIYFH